MYCTSPEPMTVPSVPDRSRAPVRLGTIGAQSLSTSLSMISCFLLSISFILGAQPAFQISSALPFFPRMMAPLGLVMGLNAIIRLRSASASRRPSL